MDLMTYLLAKQNGGGGGGSDLPVVTPADNGKILGVVKGSWSAANPDSFIDIPIIQEVGTIGSPVNLSNLSDGLYAVRGPYKVTSDSTVYSSVGNVVVLVTRDGATRYIKRITANEAVDYVVNEQNVITLTDRIVTEKYLRDNNYATKDYVDVKISEMQNVIEQALISYIDSVMDDKIDTAIDLKIQDIDNEDINDLFNNEGI